jgi:hypothetical protein
MAKCFLKQMTAASTAQASPVANTEATAVQDANLLMTSDD